LSCYPWPSGLGYQGFQENGDMNSDQSSKPFGPRITATLSVLDWRAAMEFYKSAFNAVEAQAAHRPC
jgi:hypothetical protein